jgi:hypothetical protein
MAAVLTRSAGAAADVAVASSRCRAILAPVLISGLRAADDLLGDAHALSRMPAQIR